jgi:hypothetical protein
MTDDGVRRGASWRVGVAAIEEGSFAALRMTAKTGWCVAIDLRRIDENTYLSG